MQRPTFLSRLLGAQKAEPREMGTVEVNPEVVGAGFKGRAYISAVVTRADGSIEDLGVIAESRPA